jgi:hypothetical protein
MYDSMSAEVEVLDFLKALVITIKPELVVETGTFSGLSTLRIAEGLKENGIGRVITCEWDKKVHKTATKRFAGSGLGKWIDARNESSLEMKVDGQIDMLFCDSDVPLREERPRRRATARSRRPCLCSATAHATRLGAGAETRRAQLASPYNHSQTTPAFGGGRIAGCRRDGSRRLLRGCPRGYAL